MSNFLKNILRFPRPVASSHVRKRPSRTAPPRLEYLEDRRLLSNIVWTNRGDDDFNRLVYLGTAPNVAKARQVVDTAISHWEQVIQDFHWDDEDITQFDLTIEVDNLDDGTRASTSGDHDDGDDTPYAATITLDIDAGGSGWWIDGTPWENSEFLGEVIERDVGFGTFSGNDMLRTVMHEIGHAVGVSESADGLESDDLKIGDYITDTGDDDPYGDDGGNIEVFAAGNQRVAFTTDGGLHIHEDPKTYEGHVYIGANDLMNPGRNSPDNSRKLISDLDARILEAAYGYSIKLPSTILNLSYLANRNRSGLIIPNDPEHFADDYHLVRQGNNLRVTVNETGIDVPVAYPLGGITVNSTDSFGEIDLDFAGGALTWNNDIRVNAGGSNDIVRVYAGATGKSFVLSDDGLTVRHANSFDFVKLSGVEQLVFVTEGGTSRITVRSTPAGLKQLHLEGGNGTDIVVVEHVGSGVSMTLNGGPGTDSIRVGMVPADTVSLVDGGANADTIVVGNPQNSLRSILGELFVFGGEGTGDALVLKDYGMIVPLTYTVTSVGLARTAMGEIKWAFSAGNPSGFESIGLQGGRGNDTARVESRPPDASMTIGTGPGIDTLIGRDTDGGFLPNFWVVTGVNKGTVNGMTFTAENLQGGAAKDLFTLSAGKYVTGKIDGGGGKDALDYSAFTTDVYANLWTGTATGANGGVIRIEQVLGGAGNDILVGDSVANILDGQGGRDILVGGLGVDVLRGGDGDDILIGGLISYNNHPTALVQLRNKWKTSFLNYTSRVSSLRNGVGPTGQYKLTTGTVGNDLSADSLTGEVGQDWFWGDLSEINDKAANELVGMA